MWESVIWFATGAWFGSVATSGTLWFIARRYQRKYPPRHSDTRLGVDVFSYDEKKEMGWRE